MMPTGSFDYRGCSLHCVLFLPSAYWQDFMLGLYLSYETELYIYICKDFIVWQKLQVKGGNNSNENLTTWGGWMIVERNHMFWMTHSYRNLSHSQCSSLPDLSKQNRSSLLKLIFWLSWKVRHHAAQSTTKTQHQWVSAEGRQNEVGKGQIKAGMEVIGSGNTIDILSPVPASIHLVGSTRICTNKIPSAGPSRPLWEASPTGYSQCSDGATMSARMGILFRLVVSYYATVDKSPVDKADNFFYWSWWKQQLL